jgi:hypothetical protein
MAETGAFNSDVKFVSAPKIYLSVRFWFEEKTFPYIQNIWI